MALGNCPSDSAWGELSLATVSITRIFIEEPVTAFRNCGNVCRHRFSDRVWVSGHRGQAATGPHRMNDVQARWAPGFPFSTTNEARVLMVPSWRVTEETTR